MERKTVSDIIIDRFLSDVDTMGTMPWQRPYERYNAFNYFTKQPYRGINRLLLPFGEYITKNQINQYNKDKGYIELDEKGRVKSIKPEAYRFQKGILWFPVVFFKKDVKSVSKDEIEEKFPDFKGGLAEYIGREGIWTYYVDGNGVYFKVHNILRYYEVADRRFFKNANGECLPSRIESGEMEIVKQDAKRVIDSYVKRSGINIIYDYAGTPCYIPMIDTVNLNPHIKSEDAWFSTAFHELAHSTGAKGRLNREGITGKDSGSKYTDTYAKEECIAEIAACLCCAETGVYSFETSGTSEYINNVAYVQSWKQRVKDWGKDFIYIVSQADKAFNYICGEPDDSIPDSGENADL